MREVGDLRPVDDYRDELRTQTVLILADALGARQVMGGIGVRRTVQEDLSTLCQTLRHSEFPSGPAARMVTFEYDVYVHVEIVRKAVHPSDA